MSAPLAKRARPLFWTQTLRGRAFDLLEPRAEDVDFREIADTLAQINRFNGATEKPISVAQHTLIAASAAQTELRPWVLLHDCHEAYMGDITTPVRRVLALYEVGVIRALAALTEQLDAAIHKAAGLPLPTDEQVGWIALADRRALVTERRDFLARPALSWGERIERIAPLTRVQRHRPAPDVAAELHEAFTQSLPALAKAEGRS